MFFYGSLQASVFPEKFIFIINYRDIITKRNTDVNRNFTGWRLVFILKLSVAY